MIRAGRCISACEPWCFLQPDSPVMFVFAVTGSPPRVDEDADMVNIEFDCVTDAVEWGLSFGKGKVPANVRYADNRLESFQGNAWVSHLTVKLAKEYMESPPRYLTDAVDRVREEIESIVEPPVKRRRKHRRGLEDGIDIDAEAVVRREIDGWSDIEITHREKTTVSVGLNLTCSSTMKEQHLMYRGAAAVAIADILQVMGKSVELVGFVTIDDLWRDDTNKRPTMMRICLKSADSPSDPGSLAFAATHLGFFRLLLLSAMARSVPFPVNGHMGVVGMMPRGEVRRFDIVLDSDITGFDEAVREVRRQMQGVAK